MDKQQAKDYIKGELGNYLTSKGIDVRKPFICLNPAHPDKSPSMRYDQKRGKAHCFSCGASYDTLDIIGIDYGLTDNGAIFKKAYEYFNIEWGTETTEHTHSSTHIYTEEPEKDYSAFYEEAHRHIKETDYLQRRGLSEETISRFMLGYDTKTKRVIIPISKSYYKGRAIDKTAQPKYLIPAGAKVTPFNVKALTEATKPIFIVEGEIDALSVIEVGGEAIALGGLNVRIFLEVLKTQKPVQPLIIALDNDSAGEKAERDLVEGLQELNIYPFPFKPYGEHKDASEALQADREALKAAIEEAEQITNEAQDAEQRKHLDNCVANHIQDFINGITKSVDTPLISTGFNKLDAVLDGGLYEGLYIVGAISSLGKTTLITQIADNIAQNGNDVLIFSLEMARAELMAKSISRHTLEITIASGGDTTNARTTREITAGKRYAGYSKAQKDLIQAAISSYEQYAGHIFISEGIGNIGAAQVREEVQKHISFTGTTPIVIIDYLQILAPYNERATDKQNTDKSVFDLKRISREYKTPVIGVSSFNRESYKDAVSMLSFKESGAIEYSSDVLIGLQLAGAGTKDFNVDEEKKRDPRNIELVILKNRNGKTGDKLIFKYYPRFNYFKENKAE